MGKGHKLVLKKGKMVNFKLGETNVKMKWSACHKRGTKKESDRVPGRIRTYDLPIQTSGGRSIHLSYAALMKSEVIY